MAEDTASQRRRAGSPPHGVVVNLLKPFHTPIFAVLVGIALQVTASLLVFRLIASPGSSTWIHGALFILLLLGGAGLGIFGLLRGLGHARVTMVYTVGVVLAITMMILALLNEKSTYLGTLAGILGSLLIALAVAPERGETPS